MNLPNSMALVIAAAALAGGVLAWRQHSQLEQLRAQAATLTDAAVANVPPVPSAVSPPGAPEAGPPLTEKERLEVLRLRGEVTRLRERARDPGGIRAENEKLRAQVEAKGQGGASSGLPPGYQRRREAQFAGYTSPEAALQSLLWAIEHQDTNVLFTVFDAEPSQSMRDAFAREGAEEFWKEIRILPGWQIVSTEQISPDEVSFQVEFLPGDPPQSMRLRRVNGAWRLRQ